MGICDVDGSSHPSLGIQPAVLDPPHLIDCFAQGVWQHETCHARFGPGALLAVWLRPRAKARSSRFCRLAPSAPSPEVAQRGLRRTADLLYTLFEAALCLATSRACVKGDAPSGLWRLSSPFAASNLSNLEQRALPERIAPSNRTRLCT
jgi:hypothetical protein